MAVVVRYFSTSAAGAGDGTTWANRAALFSAGNWSTVITGFAFNGSDSLLALYGPGTYTCSQSLVAGLFANAPSPANNFVLHGCDGSGNILAPPDPDWTSDQPAWDDSGLGVIAGSTNLSLISLANCKLRLVKITGSGNTTNPTVGGNMIELDWCSVTSSGSGNNSLLVVSASLPFARNCVFTMSASAYTAVSGCVNMQNCRIVGNLSASSGTRAGWTSSTNAPIMTRSTIINNVGDGWVPTSSSTGFASRVQRCTIINNGGTGIKLPSTGSQTNYCLIEGNYIANNGAYGIDAQSQAHCSASDNRLRDNTSGNFNGLGTKLTTEVNYTTDSDDATEFVNAGGGDYRIRNTSAIWGGGYGVSDQPATAARGRAWVGG